MSGRPSLYSDDLAESILSRLVEGESMVQICKDEQMPGLRTVMRWAAENDDFGTEYARAREAQAEHMDELILSAAKDAGKDPQAARVQIEAYKWRASKLAPKKFGDSSTIRHADVNGEKLELDDVGRATRLAAIFADIEARKNGEENAN